MLEKSYHIFLEKSTEDQIKELENYKVDKLMDKTIILTYIEEYLIRFFEDYKTTKKMFVVIKAR